MIDRWKVVALAAGALFLVAGTASAQSAMNKCQGSKIKDAGKKAACLAGLQAKVAGSGATLDPAKVAKCEAKVGVAYGKLEGKGGCGTTGDATAIENKVDAFVDDLVTELAVGTLPNKCQGAKIKDAGKKAACLAGLEAKFVGSGAPVDPGSSRPSRRATRRVTRPRSRTRSTPSSTISLPSSTLRPRPPVSGS